MLAASLDTAALPAEQNRSPANDRAAVVGEVRGRPRVLALGDADASGALPRALRSDHLQVDILGPEAAPTTPEGLGVYDLVVISDLPARRVGGALQQAISKYVGDGGGFIMVGGERAFGVGGWGGTVIEEILPVRFEGERQREQPTLALVLVIDKSGSMSSEDRLDLVKEAARATASTLDPGDELGVIAFDSRPYTLVRLQPAANRIRIAGDIRRLSAGGGTNALPALREAYLQLVGSKALVKHVILLSDGQSPEAGVNTLLGDMRDADITVSAVGVGAGAGKDFLARVAERGRGRYYFSQDGTDVPRIFSRETREVTRNAVVERDLYARVVKRVQLLRGLDFERAPGLLRHHPAQAQAPRRAHPPHPPRRPAAGPRPPRPRSHRRLRLRRPAALGRPLDRLGGLRQVLGPARPRHHAPGRRHPRRRQPARHPRRRRGQLQRRRRRRRRRWLRQRPPRRAPRHRPLTSHRRPTATPPACPSPLTAPGRYEATVLGVHAGQRLLKAQLFDEGQSPRRLAAEAIGQVTVPYPRELSTTSASPRSPPPSPTPSSPPPPRARAPGRSGPRSCGPWSSRCSSSTSCCAASPSAGPPAAASASSGSSHELLAERAGGRRRTSDRLNERRGRRRTSDRLNERRGRRRTGRRSW